MKKQFKSLTLVFYTAMLFSVMNNAFAQKINDFKITTVNSNKANVAEVNLMKTSDGYVLKGKVYNKTKSRSISIPGHVDISIVDTDGKILNTSTVAIYRMSRKSRFAKFSYTLKELPATDSSIRVRHHNAPLNMDAADLVHN